LAKYGPLTHEQLVQLVDCESSTFKFGSNLQLSHELRKEINSLIHIEGFLKYEAHTGQLLINTDNPNILEPGRKRASIISIEEIKNTIPSEMKFPTTGFGSEIVYVMYSTALRIEAILNKRNIWPLKVGKTNNLERRLKRLSESGPNSLCVGLVMYTDHPYVLEQFIHSALTERGQSLKITGRKEWFRSNLHQIQSIFSNYKSQGLI